MVDFQQVTFNLVVRNHTCTLSIQSKYGNQFCSYSMRGVFWYLLQKYRKGGVFTVARMTRAKRQLGLWSGWNSSLQTDPAVNLRLNFWVVCNLKLIVTWDVQRVGIRMCVFFPPLLSAEFPWSLACAGHSWRWGHGGVEQQLFLKWYHGGEQGLGISEGQVHVSFSM